MINIVVQVEFNQSQYLILEDVGAINLTIRRNTIHLSISFSVRLRIISQTAISKYLFAM